METLIIKVATEPTFSSIPEQKLWRAVLAQSVTDTVWGDYRTLETLQEKQDAEKWCSLDNPDFLEVCELAGFSPNYLYKKIVKVLSNKKKEKYETIRTNRQGS